MTNLERLVWTAALSLAASGCGGSNADALFVNGHFITMNPAAPRAEALATKKDRILWVGDLKDTSRWKGKGTRIIDLRGMTVVPGFIDAHVHLIRLGQSLEWLNFRGARSKEEVLALVRQRVAQADPDEWIVGQGWDQNDWPEPQFPTREDLERVAPANPVLLTRIDGHALWVNTRVLEMAKITKETPDPPGGRIVRDPKTGSPTGILIDRAAELLSRVVPRLGYEDRKASVLRAMGECSRVGITSIHDAGVGPETIQLYKDLLHENALRVRIYAMLRGPGQAMDAYLDKGPEIGLGGNRLTVRCIKLMVDGALGSRGAALLEPYRDDPGDTGLLQLTEEAIYDVTRRALSENFQVASHAIGDRANRVVLDAYERALKETRRPDPRLRIEHAQVLTPQDLPRFAKLAVLPSMQPTHGTSDMYWAEARLGPQRVSGAYAWRSLLDSGARIAGGSDAPVENVNPLWGIYAAVTRQDPQGWPEGGWYPGQRVSVEEALRMFTLDAAYAAFEENLKGSLEKGKLADLAVLSNDILSIRPQEILQTEVLMTVLGGEIVFRHEKFATQETVKH